MKLVLPSNNCAITLVMLSTQNQFLYQILINFNLYTETDVFRDKIFYELYIRFYTKTWDWIS